MNKSYIFLNITYPPGKILGSIILLFYVGHSAIARSDQCRTTIIILDEDHRELIGAYVEIPEIDQKAVTDNNGEVVFLLDQEASYTIKIRSMGFKEHTFSLNIQLENIYDKVIILKENATTLEEVIVSGKSQKAIVKELPFKPQVVSLNSIRAQPVPLTAILNQLPGIRIRQEGGKGSDASIMLNGIDGKGVKVFIDGVPVYLLGAGYSINTISPNIIDRIEVYKGTIPVEFGSDALGGVINIVTRYGNADYVDLSYSYGSWNTHEASVNTRKKLGPDGRYFVNIDGFYNYSDNNYWMNDVEVLIPGDPNNNTQLGRARRFNDQFKSALARIQTGIKNVKWADELMLMASFSHIDREWQHGLRAEQPWGEPTSTQNSRNASLSWKKYGKNDKWDANIMAGHTYDINSFVDTARKTYFWDQNYVTTINGGESANYSNGTAPVLTTRTWFSRESFNYSLNRKHTLNLTTLLTYDELTIRNEVVSLEVQEELLPAQKLLKNYTGLALASKFLEGELTNTISAKHFYMQSLGVTFQNNLVGPRDNNEYSIIGYGDVIQYRLNPQLKINLGYEFTVRQPDREEIFGNYLNIAPNPALRPEKSHNINMGAEFSSVKNRFNAGTTVFYRNTNDRMFLNAVTYGLARFENLIGTKALGAEFHLDYLFFKGFKAALNATYQNITLQETNAQSNIPNRFLGARIPNTPYFFGNFQLTYSKKAQKLGNGRITLGYDFNYVNEFFLSWAQDGRKETKDIIPNQALQNINFSWTAPTDRWSLGIECRNLMDARAFDNFSVQKPGRSFYIKTRFFF